MRYHLLISDEAYWDIEDAVEYYTNIPSEKLEDRFIKQLDLGIDYISNHPTKLAVKYKQIRIYNLKIFPYQIHYTFSENTILIFGVFHEKSNPNSWNDRLGNKIS